MHKIIVPALAALSLGSIGAPASAQTEKVSIAVQHSDLDLSSEAGMATLERRIARAVARLCGPMEMRPFFKVETRARCISEANASARAEIARITARDATLALGDPRR